MDEHFTTAPMEANLPVLLGMLGVWSSNFLGYRSRGIFPYCEALWRLPAPKKVTQAWAQVRWRGDPGVRVRAPRGVSSAGVVFLDGY